MKTMNEKTFIGNNAEGRRDFLRKAFFMGALLLTGAEGVMAMENDKDLFPDDKTKKNNKNNNNNKKESLRNPGRAPQMAPRPGAGPQPIDNRRYPARPRIQTPVEIHIYQGDLRDNKLHKVGNKVEKVLKKYFKEEYRAGMFHISLNHNPMNGGILGHQARQSASVVIRRRGLLGLGTQATLGRYEIESNHFEEYLLGALERFARR